MAQADAPDPATIGGRMRILRSASGLTQDAAAEACGVSQASLSRWERGEAAPPVDFIAKLAEIGGISLDWLVRGEGDGPKAAEVAAE